MRSLIALFVAIPLLADTGLDSYHRARAVLDAGAAAHGGADKLLALKTIRRTMAGDWVDSGQSPRPLVANAEPRSHERDAIVSFIDYAGSRWLERLEEANFSGDHALQIDVVTPDGGFESVKYIDEKPLLQTFATDDLPSLRIRKFRRYPEGAIRMALERLETLQYVATDADGDVISFTDALGARVLLTFDATTHLLTKQETLRDHPIAGDTTTEILYRDYRDAGGLRLPFETVDRTAGVATEVLKTTSIELNVSEPAESFRAPSDFARIADDLPEERVERVGRGVYLIRGGYNVMFAAFRDYVVVLEAPLSTHYADACIRHIHETVPDKPIRYVVATHFHFDHIAGIRSYVAEGATIVTTPDAKSVIERAIASLHTMRPDRLSRAPRAAVIETVNDHRVFDDGEQRLDLFDLGPTEHAAQILAGYFPNEKILFEPDLLDITSSDLVIGVGDTVSMSEKIDSLALDVEKIVPVHGIPSSVDVLHNALELRGKYIPPPHPLRPRRKRIEVLRDFVTNRRGDRLRVFVTRPIAVSGKVPVIFFVGWLSCDSVEYANGETDGFGSLILRLIDQSGFATVRMEKPGVGESRGTECSSADFASELDGYEAAFDSMKKYDFIDRDRVFVFGISNGGGFSPLVSRDHRVRGFISAGSWGRTWYEHMLELERREMASEGKSPAEIDAAMKIYARFYDDYLIRKRTPRQILAVHPEWKPLWHDEPDGQYGRPAAFYQQLQALNLGEAWQDVDVPVLVIHGSADDVMSDADSRAIADHVNRRHPGRATYVDVTGMTHGFEIAKQFDSLLVPLIIDWMQAQLVE
jgi:pimeloyl-ACP methyl ester carboxylesterase